MKDPRINLTPELIKLIAEIDEFKGRWTALETLSPDRLSALRRVATIESVGSSTRIEGVQLTDTQVETLLANLTATSFATRDGQEVAGYAEVMDLVFQAWRELRITENHFGQLHQTLLRHSTKDARHRGTYKTQPNHVIALDGDGKEVGVVFKTATPFETPGKMEDLLGWVTRAIEDDTIHPLLVIPVFIVTFLAIHPFQDGNGRLSRVLTTLLLLRAGYGYVPYSSLERVVEENKDIYYRALRRTQGTLDRDAPDWGPWIGFFLRCLKKQKDTLAGKIEDDGRAKEAELDLPPLSVGILRLLGEQDRLTIADLVKLTGGNRNTLKVRLRELTDAGHIRRHGKARGTWYTRTPRDRP